MFFKLSSLKFRVDNEARKCWLTRMPSLAAHFQVVLRLPVCFCPGQLVHPGCARVFMDRGHTSPEFYRSPLFWDFIDLNFEVRELRRPMAASVVFATRLCDSAYQPEPEAATVRLRVGLLSGSARRRGPGLPVRWAPDSDRRGSQPQAQAMVRLRVLLTSASDYSLDRCQCHGSFL